MLVLLAVVLTPLSVLSVWAKDTLTDTDRYVATVAPLATNPDIQAAVTTQVTNDIYREVDVAGLLQGELPPQLGQLSGPLASAVKGFIGDAVRSVVQSPAFAEIWTVANRAAHEQVIGALTGTSSAGLSVESGQVRLDLATLVRAVERQLSSAGFTAVDEIPTQRLQVTFVLFSSTTVTRVQWGFRALQTVGDWLPVVVAALFVTGVWLARDRRRALMGGALGVAAAMLVFGGAMALARAHYLDHLPPPLDRPAMGAAVDIVLRSLRQAVVAVAVGGAAVALAAILAGPSSIVRHARQRVGTRVGRRAGDQANEAGTLPTRLPPPPEPATPPEAATQPQLSQPATDREPMPKEHALPEGQALPEAERQGRR